MSIDKMISEQIQARGVNDTRVLEAMRRVPRHKFVPLDMQRSAYEDYPLPIGEGQTISQPYIVALMTELLNLKGSEKILEIGTGSGYQTAVLAELAKEIYSVEILPSLAEKSKTLLNELGYRNVKIKTGDGSLGWEEHAPFDAIIAAAAPVEIPRELLNQLAENGRMVLPVGGFEQELLLITKSKGQLDRSSIIPVRFVPMITKE